MWWDIWFTYRYLERFYGSFSSSLRPIHSTSSTFHRFVLYTLHFAFYACECILLRFQRPIVVYWKLWWCCRCCRLVWFPLVTQCVLNCIRCSMSNILGFTDYTSGHSLHCMFLSGLPASHFVLCSVGDYALSFFHCSFTFVIVKVINSISCHLQHV